jgi:hypothetical protein
MNVKESFLNIGHFQLNNGGIFAFAFGRIGGWVILPCVSSIPRYMLLLIGEMFWFQRSLVQYR